MMRGSLGLGIAIVLALSSPACVVAESPPPDRGVVVAGPPPDPIAEARPPAPAPRDVWVPGYWHWNGMQYTWIPGHWESPHPGARWHAPRYSFTDGTYRYEPGSWNP
jgi:hypothetical protein